MVLLLVVACGGLTVLAHTPLLYMEDNGDGTIYVEGAFSDGSSGAGMPLRLEDDDGETLWEGTLDDFGCIESVPIPDVSPYYVVFEGGPGHNVTKEGISPAETAEVADVAPPDSTSNASPISDAAQPVEPVSATASSPMTTAETSSTTTAWSPAATLSPEWYAGTSAETDGTNYVPALWAIVALLGFIALQLLLVGGGVVFLVGWKTGGQRRGGPSE